MESVSALHNKDIRKTLEDDVILTLFDILKKGGMHHYFRSEPGCEMNAIEVYQGTMHLLNTIESIIVTYPNDYQTILSGEFMYSNLEGFPLFVFLDLAVSFCNHTKYALSGEEMDYFQKIMSVLRNVEFSSKFNKNWHVSDKIYQCASSDTIIHFSYWSEKERYQDREGYHEYSSTIRTFNQLKYGCVEEENDSRDYLHPREEALNNHDFSSFSELECDPLFMVEIRNTAYRWGSWEGSESIWRCPLFQEQEQELEKRYETLRKKIVISKKKQRYSNFKVLLPYFANTRFNRIILSENIDWEENTYTKKMAQELELIYYRIRGYYANRKFDLERIMQQDDLDNLLKEINYLVQDCAFCEKGAKQEIVKILIEYYMQSSEFTRKPFSLKKMSKEELEQKLMELSLEDLYICRGKASTAHFGSKHIINKYIRGSKSTK